jgi:uncharacterized membrane protein
MKKPAIILWCALITVLLLNPAAFSFWDKFKAVIPQNGVVSIPLGDVNDGKAHFFKIRADDKVLVTFFIVKSPDGIIRAAVDACDVCYRSGKGYVQKGAFMVCENCGQRFATNKIGALSGGCNPAPLASLIQGDRVIIAMKEINKNSWYCQFKPQK